MIIAFTNHGSFDALRKKSLGISSGIPTRRFVNATVKWSITTRVFQPQLSLKINAKKN
jgi:hypothetical protein